MMNNNDGSPPPNKRSSVNNNNNDTIFSITNRNDLLGQEVDIIDDADLQDVDDDIDLGSDDGSMIEAVRMAAAKELAGIGVPYDESNYSSNTGKDIDDDEFGDELFGVRKGYIDDEIEREVMKGADERIEKQNLAKFRKAIMLVGFGCMAFLSVVLIIGATHKRTVSHSINDFGSAFYPFNDEGDYDEFSTVTEPEISNSNLLTTPIELNSDSVLPSALDNYLVDILGPLPYSINYSNKKEIPFFWQVPNSGSVVQSFMTACLRFTLATNQGGTEPDEIKPIIRNGFTYVNVDLSTKPGIDSASSLQLLSSDLSDVIVSPHINYATSKLLDATHQGRVFTVLRHPIDRAIASYYSIKKSVTEEQDPQVQYMTLEQYPFSKYMEGDWLTRFLTNKRQGAISSDDLQVAKEILRRKVIIGLHEDIDTSIHQFEQYFGWKGTNKKSLDICHDEVIKIEKNRGYDVYDNVGHGVDKDSDLYKSLLEFNKYDMELYYYAVALFREQQEWLRSK